MTSIKEEKPFNLLRWFSVLSFFSIGLIFIVYALLLSRFLTTRLLERDAVLTMEFVQTLAQSENTIAYFKSGHPGESREIFEGFMKKIATMPEVVRVHVYSKDGTVIWSTVEGFLGQRFMPNPQLEVALSGKLDFSSGTSGKPDKAEHVFDKEVPFFAENYIPIRSHSENVVVGAVEVYKAPLALFKEIKEGNRLVWLSAILGGSFLYVSLFWIVRRAALVIRQQHERQAAIAAENSELSNRLNLKIEELTHLQAQLIQTEKLSALGELISGVAHELNNPLTSILGFSEFLLESSSEDSTKKQLRVIQSEAIRCSKIIQGLLAFARTSQYSSKEIDLSALLKGTLDIKAHQFYLDDIKVHLEFQENLPLVSADENQIQQVFVNILSNAHQAMKGREGQRTLTIQGVKKDSFVRIVFKDTGVGIPKDILPRIFDPFFTTKPVGVGTGLGLSISYGIVKAHAGHLFAESQEGIGTQIYIDLPFESEHSTPQTESIAQHPVKGRGALIGKQILVVDDEVNILEMIRENLRLEGAEVTTALRARDGLAKLKHQSFDLILTDIKMPEMDGFKFYRSLVDQVPAMERKIIFLTGDMMNTETRQFLLEGRHPFLIKPFEINKLIEVVKKSAGF